MPKRKRSDRAGDWWHVCNRALARRTFFETRADLDFFCERLQRVSGKGWLEVHAMALLTTHFHLLVRSVTGELPLALRELQLEYVRFFNRRRRRDGPLVRGRFGAWPVDSLAYRMALVGYIDRNPVRAGLVRSAGDHEFGSARHYLCASGPAWLTRSWVESEVCGVLGLREYDPKRYPDVFHAGVGAARDGLIELRMRAGASSTHPDPTDSLLRGASPAVLDWMRRKARLADGTRPGVPIVPPSSVIGAGLVPDAVLTGTQRRRWLATARGRATCLLLRELAGQTFEEIGRFVGGRADVTRRAVRAARHQLAHDEAFAEFVATMAHQVMVATFGDSHARRNAASVPGAVPAFGY